MAYINAVAMSGRGDCACPDSFWADSDAEAECENCGEWFFTEDLDGNGHCPECQELLKEED